VTPVTPCRRQLPSGAGSGEAPRFASDYGDALAWGKGDDRVVQRPGANPLELGEDWPNQVALRGTRARVTAIGDSGEIAFVFTLNECIYTNWIGPSISMNNAETYLHLLTQHRSLIRQLRASHKPNLRSLRSSQHPKI